MSANLEFLYGEIDNVFTLDMEISQDILITGAQGLIGNALAETLNYQIQKKSGLRLYLTSRHWTSEAKEYWSKHKSVVLISNDKIPELFNLGLVIHAASPSNVTKYQDIEELRSANLGIAQKIILTSPRKIVYISTSEVYGGMDSSEEGNPRIFSADIKRDWYPLVKLETEAFLIEESRYICCNLVVVRLFHTYGPGIQENDGRSFADFLFNGAKGRSLVLKSAGTQIRTFLYVTDAVEAICKLGFYDTGANLVVNVGSSEPITIREFAQEVSEISNVGLEFIDEKSFPHSPNDSIIPNLKKLNSIGIYQKVNRKEGILNTIKWIQNRI
jgi:dTDP-glucose 4,6-dehydratase